MFEEKEFKEEGNLVQENSLVKNSTEGLKRGSRNQNIEVKKNVVYITV